MKLLYIAAALLTLAPTDGLAEGRFRFNLVLEGRLLTTPNSTSFLEGGLGKTRYGAEPRAVQVSLAQAAFLGRFDARPDLSFRLHGNADAEHNLKRRVDLVEAMVRYAPAVSDKVSLDIRAGLFFPTISLENTNEAWLSPYTTTFSAINAWIGEEVRTLGVEAGPTLLIGEAQARAFGSISRSNDPSGSLLAWRGFAMHDRVSGVGDRVPLPKLKPFKRSGLFPDQALYVQPMLEVDQKWTWATGLSVNHRRFRVKALYQPQTANPGAFDGRQYAWRTGYLSAGAAGIFGPVEVLAQGLDGETRMGVLPGNRNAVVAGFQAAYLLASWSAPESERHRGTIRYDVFRGQDRDQFIFEDGNDESGSAWTLAYAFKPDARHRITAELLRIDSTRTNRKDLRLPSRAIEILGSLSWRMIF